MCVCVRGSCVVARVVALSGLLVTNVNRSMQGAREGENGRVGGKRRVRSLLGRRLEVILFRGRKGEEEDAAVESQSRPAAASNMLGCQIEVGMDAMAADNPCSANHRVPQRQTTK